MIAVDPYNGLQTGWANDRSIAYTLEIPGDGTYPVVQGQNVELDAYAHVTFSRQFQGTAIDQQLDIDIDAKIEKDIK